MLSSLGCGDALPTAVSPGRRLLTDPGAELQLRPGIDTDSFTLQRLLERAQRRAVAGIGDPRVIVRLADGRPFTITRPVRIPEGVTLEGETIAGQRPRIRASHGGQLTIARGATCQGLHLVGPGPGSARSQAEVVPGINSGGQVDRDTGEVLRWMEGWTLRDCRIEGFSGAGINTGLAVRDVVIERVESVGNGNAGIQVGLLNERIRIVHGRYVRNGTNGIDVNGTRCHVEGNHVARNGWNRFWDSGALQASDRNGILLYIAPFRATAGPRLLEADSNVVRGNEAFDNYRAGIMAVGTSAGTAIGATQRDALIEDNRCVGNLAGVMVEGAGSGTVRDAVIRRNKLVRNGGDSEGSLKGWGFLGIGGRYPGTRLELNLFSDNWTEPWLFDPAQVTVAGNHVMDVPHVGDLAGYR